MKRTPGKFIVFEGIDGSGKTTVAERVVGHLQSERERLRFGHKGVQLTSEPTMNLIGGLIRSELRGHWSSSPECLQLLFAADRSHHLQTEIKPLLNRGITVISDRYFFSSVAYGALALPEAWLIELNKRFPVPDITFMLDVSAKTAMRRVRRSRHGVTLFERERELRTVRQNYRRLAKKFKNVFVVNGEQPIEQVTKDIVFILDRKLSH